MIYCVALTCHAYTETYSEILHVHWKAVAPSVFHRLCLTLLNLYRSLLRLVFNVTLTKYRLACHDSQHAVGAKPGKTILHMGSAEGGWPLGHAAWPRGDHPRSQRYGAPLRVLVLES